MGPVSCVSCVSSWYWVNAAETHETFHRESGMRYQLRHEVGTRGVRVQIVAEASRTRKPSQRATQNATAPTYIRACHGVRKVSSIWP